MAGITVEEWLAELSRLSTEHNNDEAMTTRELAATSGRGLQWVRTRICEAKNLGMAEVVWVRRTDITGQVRKIVGYRFKKKENDNV